MNIVFQSGEFQQDPGNDFWMTVFTQFLALLGALVIFAAGKWSEKSTKKAERRRDNLQSLMYLYMLLQGVGKAVNKYIILLNEEIEQNNPTDGQLPKLRATYWNDLRRTNNLPDHKEHYVAFTNIFNLRQENTNQFHLLFQNTEELEISVEEFNHDNDLSEKKLAQEKEILLKSIQSLIVTIRYHYPENVSGPLQPFIDKWVNEYQNKFEFEPIEELDLIEFNSVMIVDFIEEAEKTNSQFFQLMLSTTNLYRNLVVTKLERREFLSSSRDKMRRYLEALSPIEEKIRTKLLEELDGDPLLEGYEIVYTNKSNDSHEK